MHQNLLSSWSIIKDLISMTSYKTSLSKRHITMHSDNVHHIEFKISKNTVMHVSTCEIVFVKYMKAPNNEIKNCTLKQKKN